MIYNLWSAIINAQINWSTSKYFLFHLKYPDFYWVQYQFLKLILEQCCILNLFQNYIPKYLWFSYDCSQQKGENMLWNVEKNIKVVLSKYINCTLSIVKCS